MKVAHMFQQKELTRKVKFLRAINFILHFNVVLVLLDSVFFFLASHLECAVRVNGDNSLLWSIANVWSSHLQRA